MSNHTIKWYENPIWDVPNKCSGAEVIVLGPRESVFWYHKDLVIGKRMIRIQNFLIQEMKPKNEEFLEQAKIRMKQQSLK